MSESRESVYTQLSTAINRFVEHKLTKIDLYKQISGLIEMADKDEKSDRLKYEEFWEENKGIIASKDVPYSNWKDGLDRIS